MILAFKFFTKLFHVSKISTVFVLVLHNIASAQEFIVKSSSDSNIIVDAYVQIPEQNLAGFTDSLGRIKLKSKPKGIVIVSHQDFHSLIIDSVGKMNRQTIYLVPRLVELSEVKILDAKKNLFLSNKTKKQLVNLTLKPECGVGAKFELKAKHFVLKSFKVFVEEYDKKAYHLVVHHYVMKANKQFKLSTDTLKHDKFHKGWFELIDKNNPIAVRHEIDADYVICLIEICQKADPTIAQNLTISTSLTKGNFEGIDCYFPTRGVLGRTSYLIANPYLNPRFSLEYLY